MADGADDDGKVWAYCMFGPHAIWRYKNGKTWRSGENDTECALAPARAHRPEM